MQYNDIHEGDEVYWTDKGHVNWKVYEGIKDNIYKVVRKYADMGRDTIITITDGNNEYEVYISELY